MAVTYNLGPDVQIPPDRIFSCGNAASTSSAGLSTTYTGGVCLSNPAGSGMLLIPIMLSSAMVVITTGVTAAGVIVGYAPAGIVTHTTRLTPICAYSPLTPVGLVDQACTLVGAPQWGPMFASTGIAAGCFGASINVLGMYFIPPGGYIATGTSVASAASGCVASVQWTEIKL